jgi:hypothetical protein
VLNEFVGGEEAYTDERYRNLRNRLINSLKLHLENYILQVDQRFPE